MTPSPELTMCLRRLSLGGLVVAVVLAPHLRLWLCESAASSSTRPT